MKTVKSPITSSDTILVQRFDAQSLIQSYMNKFEIGVEGCFVDVSEFYLYKCPDTGYRFFYPFEIAGKSSFYKQLQKIDWYYMPWKWEHQTASSLFQQGLKLLEVGAATGGFIEAATQSGLDCIGLELNEYAVENAQQKGISLLNETLQVHAKKHREAYDIVCSFQVLEHIPNVKTFLDDQIKCLKPRGYLIISVPNNASFLGKSYNILNMPPHHMGLWDKLSLISLQRYFPIKLEQMHLEPLQSYHEGYFNDTINNFLSRRLKIRKSIVSKFSPIFKKISTKNHKAFTILAVYTKL